MDTQPTTQTQPTQTQTQSTQTQTQPTQKKQPQPTKYSDWMDDDDDFDLIEFGIASNGGRLSITPRK
jgi:hypothetical protein